MGFIDKLLGRATPAKNVEVSMGSELEKSVTPIPNTSFLDGQLDKSKAVFSLESKMANIDNIYQKKGRLQDKELKELAHYDSIISLIVSTRANQVMVFGRRARSKYDRGFIVREVVSVQDDLTSSPEQREAEVKERTALADHIYKWTVNCGSSNPYVIDHVFQGSDSTFKECSLSDFMSAQARNLLIFNRCATQIIRNKEGAPVMFRPIPVENLYRVIDQRIVSISGNDKDIPEQARLDAEEYAKIQEGRRPYAYVQRIDGKNVSFFTDDEIKLTYLQKQAYNDLDGYPLCAIEQAMYTVSLHFSAQTYMQNSLTKGLASKGIISLKTADGGIVSPEQTEHFRKLFTNYVARNDNSASIPVISGPIDVQFIELNATVKDLEFLNLYNKVIMIMCASFQISPQEIGFGNLDSAQPSLGDSSKQDQIVQGEERGLRQLVDKLFELVTGIVQETFPDAKDVLEFEGVGLGQNTKESDISLYKEELQTSGTFGKIWADSERVEAFPYGGNVPTSPLFHASVAKYMKYSDILYHFFGDKEAKDKPEYDFILDVGLNECYQNLKYGMVQMQAEQMQMQNAQLKLQLDQAQQQMQQAPAQAEMEQAQAEQQMQAQNDQEDQQQQEVEKSAEIREKAKGFLVTYMEQKQKAQEEKPKTLAEMFNAP